MLAGVLAAEATGYEPETPRPIESWVPVVPLEATETADTAEDDTVVIVADPWLPASPVPRSRPSLDPPAPIIVPRTTAAPAPRVAGGSLEGRASWYCEAGRSPCTAGYPDGPGFDAYAAAGPALRRALGDWRGRIVVVSGIRVKLVDWCQCYRSETRERLLDLYGDVADRLGITGVGRVIVSW